MIDLDEVLTKLQEEHSRKAEMAQLRYFGGLGVREMAEHLGMSTSTIEREWRSLRAWLAREPSGEP